MDRKFGRKKAHREHMMRNLVTSLILYERVTTTEPKAKELKREIDKLITIAKKGNLQAHRQALSYVFDVNAAKKLQEVLAPRYTDRTSGFSKLYHNGFRIGDAAPMAIVELIAETSSKTISETAKIDGKAKTEAKPVKEAKKTVDKSAKPEAAKAAK